ncbi:Tat pathway signal protein [Streptomyces capparidis]
MTLRTPNHHLRALIEESGLTYDGVARAVRAVAAQSGEHLATNRSTVHHWLTGVQPTETTVRYLAEALSRRLGRTVTREELGTTSCGAAETDTIGLTLDADPVTELATIGRADVNRRRMLTTAAYSAAAAALPLHTVQEAAARTRAASTGRVIGHADVDAVRHMLGVFIDADERYGGAHGRTAFAQYLVTDIITIARARHASARVRTEALSVATAGAQLAGWKAHDCGEPGLAQRYYLQALALAREGGAPGQEAFTMRTIAQQAVQLDRPERALALAETAWRQAGGRLDGQTEALFAITHAYALARAGQRQAAVAGIDRAHAALARGQLADVPFWGLAWGPPPATVQARTAKTLKALGDHRGAARAYAAAAANRPPGAYARVTALNLSSQAEHELAQGHLDEACATWHRALDAMEGVRSARTRKTLRAVRTALHPYRTRGAANAAQLDDRARLILRKR